MAIALAGLALAAGRTLLLQTHRYVVVEVSNVDGIEQVFIDCNLAARVETGESGKTFELGWLQPDDRVFLSTTSLDSTPAWHFHGTRNGGFLFDEDGGDAELPLFATEAHAVVFARAFTAAGADLGTIGCQPPNLIVIDGYAWSPDDAKVAKVEAAESSYRRENKLYDWVDMLGGWSLIALAVGGAIAAFATPPIRRFACAHKGRLGGGIVALLGVGFVAAILPTILELAGILLLFTVAILLILDGAVSLKCNRELAALGNAQPS